MIKRLLTIILTLIFALSSVATLATEEVPAEDISVEEIETLEPVAEEETQEEEISLEPMADATEITGGYFVKADADSTKTKSLNLTFDDMTEPPESYQGSFAENDFAFIARRQQPGGNPGTSARKAVMSVSSDVAPFREGGNTYFNLEEVANNKYFHTRMVVTLNTAGITSSEKLHLSYDIKTSTNHYNTYAAFVDHMNYSISGDARYALCLTDTGYFKFGTTVSDIAYSPNQWYHVDTILDFSTNILTFYIDGVKVSETDKQAFSTNMTGNSAFKYFGICIDGTEASETVDSALSLDDLSINIIPSTQAATINKKSSPLYNNFTASTAAISTPAFIHASENAEYTIDKGVFGKVATDASLKAVTEAAATDVLVINGTDTLSSINSNNLTAGQQVKLSQSFAYASNSGNVYANLLANTETVNLIKMTNDGSLYLAGTDTNVNLAAERWYNLDAIITVESDLDLLVDLYVNGILAANGTITYDEAYSTEANTINIAKIVFGADAASETYYDDVYVNTFSGTGDDVATPNASITESSDLIDTADEIGKALVDPGMLLDDFVAAISFDANIKVYKDGTEAVSGYAAGTLAVSGEETYLPTYCYVYATVVLDDPTFTAGTGKVTVSTNVASMLSNPRTVTMIVATYVEGDDGISRIHSVKPKTIDCIGQTNEYSIDAVIPETYFDTVRPEPSADSSASEDETTEEPEVLKAPAEKVSIKVFTTTGWDENLPAFGDTWTVTLYELLTA